MNIGKFYSKPKHTFFSPSWEYYLGQADVNNPFLVNDLKALILSKEKDIITKFTGLGVDAQTGLGVESMTAKYRFYQQNYLHDSDDNGQKQKYQLQWQ